MAEEKQQQIKSSQQQAVENSPEFEMDLLNTFLSTQLTYKQKLGAPKNYFEADARVNTYKKISEDDEKFSEYIKSKYGTLENFLMINQKQGQNRVYDPESDYDVEVEIITEDQYFTSDFISSSELFLEVLGGVSTVQYFKKNGQITQTVGTLKKSLIPSSEYETRDKAFAFYGSPRILIWDVVKQDWASFYMTNVRRFIRDDTTALQ